MKKIGLAVGVPTALGMASGLSATLPATAADYAPPPHQWDFSGPYWGVSGGISWLHASADDSSYLDSVWTNYGYGVTGTKKTSDSALGGLFGGTLGYNFQSGNFVYGVEGDISWLGGNSVKTQGDFLATSLNNPYEYGYGYSARKSTIDGLATLRARASFDVDGILVYGRAGLAIGQD